MTAYRSRSAILALTACLSSFSVYAAPPPNDNFADATVISGFPVTVTGSNIEATLEPGEPLPEGYEFYARKSVWYQWTAPTSGLVQIDTFGSYYQPMFGPPLPWFNPNPAVWTGTSVTALTELRSGGSQQSRYLDVVSGTTYRVAVYGLANDFLDEGQIVLNITNDSSSHISGNVTGPDGTTPLQGILAQANRWNGSWWENVSWDFTDSAGNYMIRGLSNDTYRVVFFDWENRNGTPQYITEYYDNAEDWDSADDIVVPPSTTISNINAALAAAAQISGTITGPDTITPLEGIGASAYRWNATWTDWEWIGETESDSSGAYTIGGLPPGTYHIQFNDWANGDYIPEVYDDAADLPSGTDIAVTSGAAIVGIDAALADASKISGTVTGPDGVTTIASIVQLYHWNGVDWDQLDEYWADDSGSYTFGGLNSGTYRIHFADFPYDEDDYLGEFFNGAASFDNADDIILPAATTLAGRDASLLIAQPIITGIHAGPTGLDVLFTGVEGRDYMLQRGLLESNSWGDVGTPTNCVAGTNILTVALAAPNPFADDFDDNSLDTTKWPYYTTFYSGVFAEVSSHLEFTTAGAPATNHSNEAYLKSATIGQYSNDFSLVIDLANYSPANAHRSSHLLVELTSANNWGNQLAVQFADFSTGQTFLGTYLRNNWANIAGSGTYITTDVVRVRIDFNSQAKVLSTYYDINPSNADNWIPVDSYGIDGSDGIDGNTDWGLTGAATFFVGLRGQCSFDSVTNYVGIATGQVFFDNARVLPSTPDTTSRSVWRVRRYP